MTKGIGLSGMTWSSLKKNPALIPLYGMTLAGALLAGLYVARLATRSPEVTWSRARNPEPWNDWTNKQYKFVATRDYTEGCPAPDYAKKD